MDTKEKILATREDLHKKGKDFLSQTIETGKGVLEMAHGEFAEVVTELLKKREKLEKEGKLFLEKTLQQQRTDLRNVEKRVVSAVDNLVFKFNEIFLTRLGVLEKTLKRLEDRIKKLEEKIEKYREKIIALPIVNYEKLNTKQIVAKLSTLGKEDLEKVRNYENSHKKRETVIKAIDERLS